ncbi:MAG TPA: alpha-glucan family phosphorylase [Bryobacteraceae bacterium]|nr:alpha-glucan family phosphorylase [Bryobacteraceae bacterium]HOQ45238.1 alpha-glucan family phosphorylase [Bryobacteraceae bacterium]HPQ14514.1 alpha-glucan family phosphorylase [Bryobacteraceae bacterium]HPU71450.1 alpha-glucan family phosphorylase [Bryobacteraceae bacterium]
MSNPISPGFSRPVDGVENLAELALDLRWSWNHASDELWGRLDPELWELTANPWVVLQTVSRKKLLEVSADPEFRRRVEEILREKRAAEESPAWFQKAYPDSSLTLVAYFSMEYMLTEALQIYSGGLGNVAGDQLKAASDLGVPVVGVGLLYQQGYFRQEVDAHGNQLELYPFNDPGQLPITPLRESDTGEWLRLSINLPGLKLWLRTWEVRVGRTKLYLLDSNDPANPPAYRGITSELYGGGPDLRLKQELALGIGGWRLLRALGLKPEVCHLNEGHAAFAVLERARSCMAEMKVPFDTALTITRAGNLFTTHTPVDAGFDRFDPSLMERFLKRYVEHRLCIPFERFLALGRRDPCDRSEPFNMAYLAIRGSGDLNAVSRLHGVVSRRIFQGLFPRWPEVEVPVGHVTNGVHVPTWDSEEADRLWTESCGKGRWLGETAVLADCVRRVDDERLWELRTKSRRSLIEYVRKRLARQYAGQGASREEIEEAARVLDFDVLTIGFARRFATYKRPNLLLTDPERLMRILTNRDRPAQLILAGKAHPQDEGGQALIKEWHNFVTRREVRCSAVFLADYDMALTEHLVRGVDLWINTPRRPYEACGTSGMKVLVNGGLNVSELDGWWAEAYSPEVGWAIGDGKEHGDDPAWDAVEARQLYDLLEREIIPQFYARNARGIPEAWVAKVRESMARLTPFYSANRTVREYTEEHYLPAAAVYRERCARGGALAAEIQEWQKALEIHWGRIRFGAVRVETSNGEHCFEAQVYLGELDPSAVRVELYAEGTPPTRKLMDQGQPLVGAVNGFLYSARVPADRPASNYTPRVVPFKPGAKVPLEAPFILWQQ